MLTENIGLRPVLRIYKACGMNGFNIDDKILKEPHRRVGAQNGLSEGQVNAFLMYLSECLPRLLRKAKQDISSCTRSGPTILNTSAVDLSRGVIASLLASYQIAVDKDEKKETLLIEEALANVVLTAFHVLRQSGLRKRERIYEKALQGFSPYPARILPRTLSLWLFPDASALRSRKSE